MKADLETRRADGFPSTAAENELAYDDNESIGLNLFMIASVDPDSNRLWVKIWPTCKARLQLAVRGFHLPLDLNPSTSNNAGMKG